MKKLVLKYAPVWLQNAAISAYNWKQWRTRRSGVYAERRRFFGESALWDREQWLARQAAMLDEFLRHATRCSRWYSGIDPSAGLAAFPLLEKRDLVANLDRIQTLNEAQGMVSHTGGTTGASLKVVYSIEDMQTRFAMLDWFRSLHGWELGRRTAWFSGKSLVRDRDVRRGIVWRDDWINGIRFFSTFHVNERNFDAYWRGLTDFAPEFIVGFPSSLAGILAIARSRGLTFPAPVKVFFPTAETVLPEHRALAADVLGCVTRDQYASSEGAPFILECSRGQLHLMPLSGVFEVVDDELKPAGSGELIVTSFTTHGTPLIRYRVGDRVTLADPHESCACGWTFPLVTRIEGRTNDFVWSPEFGRINLGNLSNTTKGIAGILAFQIEQSKVDAIHVRIQASPEFDEAGHKRFLEAMRLRVGAGMRITHEICDELLREKSGKIRLVRNRLPQDQMRLAR